MTIGNRIRKLRKEKKVSQLQMAIDLGLTQTTISLWECDNRKLQGYRELVDLCNYFGVSADYLLCLKDKPQ